MRAARALGMVAVAVALALASAPAHADKAAAEAAFQKAKELATQGKYADACPLFESSYKADPALGALLNLADCHEHVGKTATAWAEFDDAATQAHRASDAREAYAKQRADALLPKLAHLTLHPPLAAIPRTVVTRDDTDVTALVGAAMPVDPGAHVITESAPGYTAWTQTVTVPDGQAVELALGDLEKAPEAGSGSATAPATAAVTVRSQAGAQIAFDGAPAGTGTATATLARGPHTLRVTAPGFRAFQQEVYVNGGDDRAIDVPPLDAEVVGVVVEAPSGPRFEAAASIAPGVKLRRDDPAMLDYRLQIGVHLGRYTTLSLFGEFGSVSAANGCGTDLEGSQPGTPFDFGNRNVFASCKTAAGGLDVAVRFVRRDRAIQPFLDIAPSFGVMFVSFTPTTITGMSGSPASDTFLRILTSVRAGVDFRPGWLPGGATIGPFADLVIAFAADEQTDGGGTQRYLSMLGGVRSTLSF